MCSPNAARQQWFNFTTYLGRLVDNFGLNTLLVIVSSYAGLKGLTYQLVSNVALPFYRSAHFSGDQYQVFNIVTALPWSMKSTVGLLSDCVPLFGYHKRSYIVLFSVLGTMSLLSLAVLGTDRGTSASVAAGLFALFNLQVAAVDLLTEGKYAELMVAKPDTGSDLVSFVQGIYAVGGIFGSLLTAPLITFLPLPVTFVVCALFSVHVVFLAVFGVFPERRRRWRGGQRIEEAEGQGDSDSDSTTGVKMIEVDMSKLRSHDRVVKLSILITASSVLLAVITVTVPDYEPIASMLLATVLLLSSMHFLSGSKTLRNVNLYLFLNNAMYVPISGALSYFFTAGASCVADGPHFSTSFYVSVGAALSQFAYLLGAFLFQICFSRGSFRRVIIITNVVKAFSCLADILIVTRLNRRLHIPDRALFIFGDAVFYHVAYRFELIPLIVLTSKVCPPRFEASVYALLTSFQNNGGALGQSIGLALIKLLNIRTVEPCDFSNLPALVVIARLVLPIMTVPLVFWLIPDAKLTDDLVERPHSAEQTEEREQQDESAPLFPG